MFIDEVKILVKAGDGGNGCLAFRREKFVPRGGPSGGDGGRGGNVTMTASKDENTLLRFRFNPEHKAQRGRHGEGSDCRGLEGKPVELSVPIGTVVYDEETGEKLFDFTEAGQTFRAAKGGRGGRGNARFVSSTHQAPTEHEDGKPGEEKRLRLELKLLADVGLVGFPNAGKSTLIKMLSGAYTPDAGQVLMNGQEVHLSSPRAAQLLGISPKLLYRWQQAQLVAEVGSVEVARDPKVQALRAARATRPAREAARTGTSAHGGTRDGRVGARDGTGGLATAGQRLAGAATLKGSTAGSGMPGMFARRIPGGRVVAGGRAASLRAAGKGSGGRRLGGPEHPAG